jgi:hypothetical protein
LYKKNYPQDTCGIIDKKIQLLQQAEQEAVVPVGSSIQLSTKKGIKVNFIRVMNCLFELSFFTDRNGADVTKKELFDTLGKAFNHDFAKFQNDLSAGKAAANADMKSTLTIYEQMLSKQQELNLK